MDFSTISLAGILTTAESIIPVAMSVVVPILGYKFGIRFLISLVAGL